MTDFDLITYRVERCRELERQNELLRFECERLVQLLAESLRVATAGTGVSPTALLDVLGDLIGTNLGMAAFVVERERCDARRLVDRTIRLLKETG